MDNEGLVLAAGILVLAIAGGVVLQLVAKHEAAVLGLSAMEVAALGLVVGSAITRKVAE
jgi:hypothetical protein